MVYAVKLGNNLKIGYSGNIRNRLQSFKTTNPDLILIALKPGEHSEERRLHYIFKEYLIHSEIFKLTEDSLNLLRIEFKECFDLLSDISLDTLELLCDSNYQEYIITKLEEDSKFRGNEYLYTFDLERIGQAVLFNRKKIEEHDEILHEMQEEIERLNHEVKLLHKELGDKNKESVKSTTIKMI